MCQVLLSSHLGRPKDGPEEKFSLAPVSERLTKLLGKKVGMAPDCIGPEVGRMNAHQAFRLPPPTQRE